MDEIRVRVRATGVERTVTRKSYMASGPKVYEKLGPVEAEPQSAAVQAEGKVYRSVSAPVIRPQIKAEQAPEPEQEAGEEVPAEATPETPVKRKPGRPAGYKKSISSNSMEDEK